MTLVDIQCPRLRGGRWYSFGPPDGSVHPSGYWANMGSAKRTGWLLAKADRTPTRCETFAPATIAFNWTESGYRDQPFVGIIPGKCKQPLQRRRNRELTKAT